VCLGYWLLCGVYEILSFRCILARERFFWCVRVIDRRKNFVILYEYVTGFRDF
jgi:hypothetical protein